MGRQNTTRGDIVLSLEIAAAVAGLIAALTLGAWWTGSAAAQGSVGGTLLRFVLSVAGGCYYLVLYRIARYSVHHPARRFR